MSRTLTTNRIAPAILVLAAGLCLSGCNPARTDLAVFDYRFEAADYSQAGIFAQQRIHTGKTPSGNDLLWTLQLASAERMQFNHPQAIASFDKAEEMLNYYAPQSELVDAVGSTIVNDNLVPYKGEEYDGIMVNTYKALDFLAERSLDLARVELNRALDRQTRAREHFNEEIRKLEAKLDKQKQKSGYDFKALAGDPNTLARVNALYPNIDQFRPYPDFVNPFTTYLAAVYFALVGEYQRAGYLFKESAGMVPDNDYIAKDLLLTDDVIAGKAKPENMVWVIFENGLGPVKEEVRIDLPLFTATRRVQYIGIALPRLRRRDAAYPCLILETDAGRLPTKQVADMDRVIQTEFQKDFGGILARAIASAVLKTTAQAAMRNSSNNDLANDLAAALMGIYSYATTAADVRIWTALPKDFQVARCAIPRDRRLKIAPAGGVPFEINIPTCRNAIVYIKIVRTGALPVYEVLTF